MSSKALAAAISTLQAEAKALTTLASKLKTDKSFTQAVDLICKIKGRVVVTGVGKSGHIGGKIAATLASTGTPAFFVHPTEAHHGDLGMITQADVILALSHSGESKELASILQYASRFSIPLIALTGKSTSTLAKAATIILNNQVVTEACPLNLAPTTSTTATLALADALAVALMTQKGFTKQDFAKFHPGGKLGAQLLRVTDVMVTEKLPLMSEKSKMNQVLITLTQRNLGCVGFTNAKGHLTGVFTDGDLKRRLLANATAFLGQSADKLMTSKPKTIDPEGFATAAVAQMDRQKISSLWVIKSNKIIGLVRLADLVHAGVV